MSLLTVSPFVLVLHPGVPARTLRDLIAAARAAPGSLSYASAGTGSVIQLGMELLKSTADLDIRHVPYKGSAPGLTDVLGGHVAMMLFAIPPVVQHVRLDRLRALAVTGPARAAQLPEVPTMIESGMKGYEITTWTGMLAPRNTPAGVVQALNQALVQVVRSPDIRAQLDAQGVEAVGGSPEAFAAFLRAELARNAHIIRASGARPG